MQRYYIRDVCRILKIKKHIIRYWEQEIPFLVPRKDLSRNRIYTLHDLNLFYRLKYLMYRKKLPLHEASAKLWSEITAEDQDVRAVIYEVRSKLLILYSRSQQLRDHLKEIL